MERPVRPRAEILEVLKGEISGPITTVSNKPGQVGQEVEVNLVKEGSGMLGLEYALDNREWAGINNHIWLTARFATHFSRRLKEAGYETDPQRVLNGMLASHPGRRQWDEAGWYPDVVSDAQGKRSISNETLGMQLIQGKVPQEDFELVVALGHNVEGFSADSSIYDSWDFKVAIYTDHRTAQNYGKLNERMGDFLLGNFFKREEVTPELKEQVYAKVGEIIEKQKETGSVSLEEADKVVEDLGATADSARLSRRDLMRLIINDADTEAALIKAGIDPDDVSEKTVPMPRWEKYLRRLYINDAEEDISRLAEEDLKADFMTSLSLPPGEYGEKYDKDFLINTWWGSYVRELSLEPYISKRGKPQGIQRAIEFFRKLDQTS